MLRRSAEQAGTAGLVLTGGGARAAYQVGVLKAIAEMLPAHVHSPFPVVTGTSAGAINAAVLAAHASDFRKGVRRLERVWGNFRTGTIYRDDWRTVLRTGVHWLASITIGGMGRGNPTSLLDNTPLRKTLLERIRFEDIGKCLEAGHLRALGVTVSGYASARSITFYQCHERRCPPWERSRRVGQPTEIGVEHLMASAAMPFIFPAIRVGREYCGDGVIRQSAPLSPAIHLGADRLLVIGVRNEAPNELPAPGEPVEYPTFGHIAGYMLDALFMDSQVTDIERMERINRTLGHVSDRAARQEIGLRHIDHALVVPSEDIREIARAHAGDFPRSVRMLLSGVGALNTGGRQLMSYLLFEAPYTRALIELGYRDGRARRDRLESLLLGGVRAGESAAGTSGPGPR